MSGNDFRQNFDDALLRLFKEGIGKFWRDPGAAWSFTRILSYQRQARDRRRQNERRGLVVPAVMIISVTRRCNLHCAGCYSRLLRSETGGNGELGPDRLREILNEAASLGTAVVFLAGGEPLLRPEIVRTAAGFPRIAFPMFTNGTLVDNEWGVFFQHHRNIIPVLSLEGHPEDTEERRGQGILARLDRAIDILRLKNLFWAVSFTVTRENFASVVSRSLLERLFAAGGRAFFFVEYVPIEDGSEKLALTESQKKEMIRAVADLRKSLRALFVMLPGDETEFGGCLAAGRGFLHINADGALEPCPFAPYSDTDVREGSLKQALGSKLLARIRERHHELTETAGGCALWARREWLEKLAAEKKQ